jgi:type IV pilus assembly protein PilV
LIEVLVSMLLLAIGMHGIAALQITGSQFSHDSYLRSQITMLMYDMVDRMRINSANASDYDNSASPIVVSTGTPPACNQTNAPTAANDLNCFQALLMDESTGVPPGTTATIDNVSGTNEYTILVSWSDREGSTRNISYRFEP